MQKYIFLLLLSLTLGYQLFSQSYYPKWGHTYKVEKGLFRGLNFVGMEENHYYLLMSPARSNTILEYDLKHKLINHTEPDLEYNNRRIVLEKFVTTRNGTFGLLTSNDRKADKWGVFIRPFHDGLFGKTKQIFEHDYRQPSITYAPNLNDDIFNTLTLSPDSSLAVYTNARSMSTRNKDEEYVIAVFDADLKLKWEKVQQFDYPDSKMDVMQSIIGNDGAVYLLAIVAERKDKKGLPKYDYKAFRITEDAMEEITIELGTDIAPVSAALFLPKNTSDFVLTGFYTNSERTSDLKGVFYARGNTKTGITNKKIHKFDTDFLEDIATKRSIKKDQGLYGFYIQRFFQNYDGEVGFIAERRYVTRSVATGSRNSVAYTPSKITYHSDALVIAKFSEEGQLSALTKVPKNYRSEQPEYTSFASFLVDDNLYLLFNDQKSRKERKKLSKKEKGSYDNIDIAIIRNDGKIGVRKTIFDGKEHKLDFVPKYAGCDGRHIVLGCTRGKKYVFGTIGLYK